MPMYYRYVHQKWQLEIKVIDQTAKQINRLQSPSCTKITSRYPLFPWPPVSNCNPNGSCCFYCLYFPWRHLLSPNPLASILGFQPDKYVQYFIEYMMISNLLTQNAKSNTHYKTLQRLPFLCNNAPSQLCLMLIIACPIQNERIWYIKYKWTSSPARTCPKDLLNQKSKNKSWCL